MRGLSPLALIPRAFGCDLSKSSLPGLTRQSIALSRFLRFAMGARVKPARRKSFKLRSSLRPGDAVEATYLRRAETLAVETSPAMTCHIGRHPFAARMQMLQSPVSRSMSGDDRWIPMIPPFIHDISPQRVVFASGAIEHVADEAARLGHQPRAGDRDAGQRIPPGSAADGASRRARGGPARRGSGARAEAGGGCGHRRSERDRSQWPDCGRRWRRDRARQDHRPPARPAHSRRAHHLFRLGGDGDLGHERGRAQAHRQGSRRAAAHHHLRSRSDHCACPLR